MTNPEELLAVLVDALKQQGEDPHRWVVDRLPPAPAYGGGDPIIVARLLEGLLKHPDAPVRFVDGSHPGLAQSWRGDYAQLAISHHDEPQAGHETAGQLAEVIHNTRELEGYKGGVWSLTGSTEVWCDCWGAYTDNPIAGVDYIDGVVYLRTTRKPGARRNSLSV